MDFQQKIEAIEKARIDYPAFNEVFLEYLGLGNSFNGAYNHFSLKDIAKYEPAAVAPTTAKPVTAAPKAVAPTPSLDTKTPEV
jgi:hypothetical protein